MHAQSVTSSVRRYSGEHLSHVHDHAQVLFALSGSMELEVGGRALFADVSTGLVIPAGLEHGYLAPREVRMLVIDAPDGAGLDRMRRFAVTANCRRLAEPAQVVAQLAAVLDAPDILARRRIDLARLDAALAGTLHEAWPTARMAALFCLSAQRFHARLLELAGQTPQDWLRERRLDAAQCLLQRGVALEATALQVGYLSASALCFALRRDRRVGARGLRAP
jgi:AraC-like DNA-binding protein